MDWVKRNLYFVIGSAVAVVLMGLAAFYLYSGWRHKNEVFEKLSAQYAELKRLYELNPNPGSDKVDNIRAAREQQNQLREFIRQASKYFVAPAPIPQPTGTNRVSGEEFTSALRRTVEQLRRDAANASVTLPNDYYFSFEAQKTLMRFAPGSLDLLAVQLGEIKALCDVLFGAKINTLEALRRERVSTDDYRGPLSDYLDQKSVTNDLAVLVPYEVTFRCFSAELANVLNGFHSAPYSFLVKTVDVEPASAMPGQPGPGGPEGSMGAEFYARYGIAPPSAETPPATPGPMPQRYALPDGAPPVNPYARYGVTPGVPSPMQRYAVGGVGPEGGVGAAYAQRYGGDTTGDRYGGGGASLGGIPYRPLAGAQPGGTYGQTYAMPSYPTPAMPAYPPIGTMPVPGAPSARGGLQTVLDEQPIRVTLLIHVVKLLPKETRR